MAKKSEVEMTQRPMIDAASVNRQIAKYTEKLVQLEKVRTDSQAQVARIEKMRQAQLVEALTGNADAQKRLTELNLEMDAAKCADQDAADAIAQVAERLKDLNTLSEMAGRQARREHARQLIETRRDGRREQRISELVHELDKAAEELLTSYREIADGVRAFDPSLEEYGERLVNIKFSPRLSWVFHLLGSRDDREALAALVGDVPVKLDDLLARIDAVIVPGEELAADRRLYRTTCNLNSSPKGSILSLRTGDAETKELLDKGYVEEVSGTPAPEESAAAEAAV